MQLPGWNWNLKCCKTSDLAYNFWQSSERRPQILNVVVVTQQVNELYEDVFLVAEAPLESREVASEKAITCPTLVT